MSTREERELAERIYLRAVTTQHEGFNTLADFASDDMLAEIAKKAFKAAAVFAKVTKVTF